MVKVMLGIISVTLIWGYTWVAMKVGIHDIPPLLFSGLRLFIGAVPLFLILFIQRKKLAFSGLSVRALKNIKYCAVTISIFYAAGMPVFYLMAEIDDAPGIIVIGLVIIFASMVIAVFAAVLQKLLKEAIDIKSENDLTV